MEKKNVVFLTVLAVATLLTAVVGTTFAYFTATVTGNAEAQETEITTATLGVTYDDGTAVANASNILPGWTGTKTIKVTNTSNVDVTYGINWTGVTNGFVADVNPADSNVSDYYFVYSVAATTSTTGTAGVSTLTNDFTTSSTEIDMPSSNSAFVASQSIHPGETHQYVITMKFKEAGYPQDANQGKTFKATFQVAVQNVAAVAVTPGS